MDSKPAWNDSRLHRSLLCGLKFVRSGCFVNMSRVNPRELVAESDRVRFANTKLNAVGIMLGVVSECFIVEEAMVGTSFSSYAVHKITIVPFAQEMRRDTSVWGHVLGFHTITGPVTSDGISFSTRKKADGNQSERLLWPQIAADVIFFVSDSFLTPKKTGGIFMTVSSPLASSSTTHGASYPSSRAFEDQSMFFPLSAFSLILIVRCSSHLRRTF
jgi:hypothetical protein